MDLSALPTELKENSVFNYTFTIIDHFSLFIDSYLLKSKDQDSDYILGSPLEFGRDNGRELLYNSVKKLS